MMEFETDIRDAVEALRRGGVILYPTDTIWGLGCDATDPQAVQRIFELKKRPPAKSMIVLMADEKEVRRYTANPEPAVFDYLKTTSTPTTVIYQGAIGLADNLVHTDGSVAVRIVQDAFCRHLLRRFRKPLVSTSANFSGEAAPAAFREINPELLPRVDYVVKYRQDDNHPSVSSAIVKWEKDGSITYLRR